MPITLGTFGDCFWQFINTSLINPLKHTLAVQIAIALPKNIPGWPK